MIETWEVLTSLYIVRKFCIQRRIVDGPGRRFGGKVEREVQKGNDDRCAICSSASDVRTKRN